MGRSFYTPSTVNYLAQQAAAGTSQSAWPVDAGYDSGTLCVGHEEIKYGSDAIEVDEDEQSEEVDSLDGWDEDILNLTAASVEASRRRELLAMNIKNPPLPWAERSFDPDDKQLPLVTERFLSADEVQDRQSLSESNQESDSADGLSEVDEDDEVDLSHYRMEAHAGLPDTNNLDVDSEYNVEDLSAYDATSVPPRSFIQIAGDYEGDAVFSPSAAVFHTHTLPFTLPTSDSMQMQRRSSATSAASRLHLEL